LYFNAICASRPDWPYILPALAIRWRRRVQNLTTYDKWSLTVYRTQPARVL
jgi:hypothetical protein